MTPYQRNAILFRSSQQASLSSWSRIHLISVLLGEGEGRRAHDGYRDMNSSLPHGPLERRTLERVFWWREVQRWGCNRDEAEAPGAAEGQSDPLKTAASAAWQPITLPETEKEPQINNNQTQGKQAKNYRQAKNITNTT